MSIVRVLDKVLKNPMVGIFSTDGGPTPEPPPVTLNRTVLLEFDDVSSIVTSSPNVVSQVNDKSGNGNNFTAVSTPATGGLPQNSLNVVELIEGDSSYLECSGVDMTNSFTIYLVAKVKTVNSVDDTLISIEDNLGNRVDIKSNNATKFNSEVISNIHTPILPGGAPYEQNYMVYKYELDHLNNTGTLSINGTQLGQEAYIGTMGTAATIKLGRDSSSTQFLECGLAEFYFYEGVVSSGDDTTIINFLNSKWAILDPRDLPNIAAFYDPSNINAIVTGPVLGAGLELNTLIDISGGSNNLDSTASYRPIARQPGLKKNGLFGVEFDSIQKSMKKINFPVNNIDSSMTFVFLTNVIPVGISNFNQSVISWNQFPNDFNIESGSSSNVFNCIADGTSGFHSNLTPTGTPYNSQYHVFLYKLDGVAGTASLIIDNVFRGQVNDYTGSLITGDFLLNANKLDQTQGLIQNFLEMIVLHEATSVSTDTEIYNYLKGKWDL